MELRHERGTNCRIMLRVGKERDDWRDGGAFVRLYPFMPTNCLMDLPDWSDPEPLDIVQTLRDAGVTLTDPNQP